jgi:hypothetical protein
LNKKVKDIKQEPKNAQLEAPKTTNNIFLGSTTDLQRILQQEREIDVTPKSE